MSVAYGLVNHGTELAAVWPKITIGEGLTMEVEAAIHVIPDVTMFQAPGLCSQSSSGDQFCEFHDIERVGEVMYYVAAKAMCTV